MRKNSREAVAQELAEWIIDYPEPRFEGVAPKMDVKLVPMDEAVKAFGKKILGTDYMNLIMNRIPGISRASMRAHNGTFRNMFFVIPKAGSAALSSEQFMKEHWNRTLCKQMFEHYLNSMTQGGRYKMNRNARNVRIRRAFAMVIRKRTPLLISDLAYAFGVHHATVINLINKAPMNDAELDFFISMALECFENYRNDIFRKFTPDEEVEIFDRRNSSGEVESVRGHKAWQQRQLKEVRLSKVLREEILSSVFGKTPRGDEPGDG